MFRKPKRKLKDTLRKKDDEDEKRRRWNDDDDKEEDDHDEDATTTLRDTIVQSKREILDGKSLNKVTSTANQQKDSTSIMHTFDSDKGADGKLTSRNSSDLVTSTAQHHPTAATNADNTDLIHRNDGIYRGDQIRNKFHAGPIRAPTNIRTTARFDYQPDICKDYKDTGFCGYGDTCIYLHDRTDTISGWQLEQQWEQQQKIKREQQEQIMNCFVAGSSNNSNNIVTKNDPDKNVVLVDDGIPFACYLCREHFKDPVVTNCYHYYCEKCIMDHIRSNINDECPICHKDTGSVFNCPTKLITKKRKLLGNNNNVQDEESWIKYFQTFKS